MLNASFSLMQMRYRTNDLAPERTTSMEESLCSNAQSTRSDNAEAQFEVRHDDKSADPPIRRKKQLRFTSALAAIAELLLESNGPFSIK
jgi:hypothetical protein